MNEREVRKRLKEYSQKEIDYLVGGYSISKRNYGLLKQIITLGKLLNRYCFIESSLHLQAAKDCMVRDLRKKAAQ